MDPCRTMLVLVAMALCRIKIVASNESSNLTSPAAASDSTCGGVLPEVEFSLRSPGFPVQYPAKTKCEWRVARKSQDVCGLELTFQTFDLEPSDNCTYDFLEVEQNRLCGKINDGSVRVFMFAENETAVRFVSDNQNSRSGFDIRVRQIATCSPDAPGFSCSRTYDQKEFFIRSPDYPGNYSHDANCTYRVIRHSKRVCALKVTFASFHLEESVNCKNDFFSVDDRKFCGLLEDATTQTFPFQGNEKTLSFRSDSSVSGSGFFAHVQQEECEARSLASPQDECSTEIKTMEFELKSPGYPMDAYADDLSCRYRVIKSSPLVCDLMITIQDFQLQEGEVCENDYLQIAEERLCGTIESGMTRMYSFGEMNEILMNFDTDGSKGDKGFHISGLQKECNSTMGSNSTEKQRKAQAAWDCDRTITGSEDSIRSPGFPDAYPANVDCRWMVMKADSRYCELEITIHSLHIQVGESCQFDYLEVDGHRFCGSTTAGNKRIFSFKTEQIVIHFHSDDTVNDRGFEVTLKQRDCPTTTTTAPAVSSCDQVFDSKHFILVSPNHPRDYDNGLDCRYVIRRSAEDVCRLEMEFLRFDVESSSNCEYDYLAINGEKICGLIENTTRTYLFQDYEKQLTFHSDSGTSRPGFMIRVQQVDCSVATTEPPVPPAKPCDQRFSSPAFEIRSDNHPDNYDPHLRCTYTVSRTHPGVCALELTFLTFDVEASDGCQYDYLKLQEEKLCGIYPANLKRIIPFEDSEITLEFHSDGATSRPGFHIRGQQMDCAPLTDQVAPPPTEGGCNSMFTNASGTLQSPGFPEPYPGSQRCVYRFAALPEHCRITFQFLEFGLQADNALCEKDFLRINGIKYCGPQLLGQKRTVTFYGYPREVNVTFESDAHLSDKGFYAVYRQLPCSPALGRSPSQRTDGKTRNCDRLYASLAFSILSPGHPDNYPADVDCRYTIRRLGPRICRLKMSFRQFDIESSEGCEYDYLEVDGKKICGTVPVNEIRMVEFRDYQTIFTFHSDSANSKPGFVIKVEQEECQDASPQPPKPPKGQPPKFEPHLHFEPPVAEPPLLEEPYIYPQPHFEFDHLVDYPIYEASSLQRNLQMANQNCDRTFQRPEFEIRSVNFPQPYPNGLNCRYLVQKASDDICWVKLIFLRFDLEPSDDCHFDYLSINGKRICGTLPDDEIRAYLFNSEEISMYFRSDGANAHRGFLIRGEQLKCKTKGPPAPSKAPARSACDQSYERDLFVVQSPNFPDPYPAEAECTFTIRKANRYICGLQLTMLAFDIENQASCEKDYLQIEEDKLCGPIPTRTIRTVPFAGETVVMKFKSDSKTERPGFSILVQQLEDCEDIRRSASSMGDCSHEFSAETFLLQSPRFPEEYPADSSCEYRIRRRSPSHCRLELKVLSFDVEEGTDGRCSADCLELPAGYTLCGQLPKDHTESLIFSEDEIVLKFRSDSTTQRPGFSIQVRQATDCGSTTSVMAPEEKMCGGVFDSEEFSLKSPNFPHDYPHDAHCEYLVKKQSEAVCGLELKFAHFDVEKGPDCSYDYLDIGHKTICGTLPSGFTRVIPFENPEMKFTFHSDKGTSKSGFAIKVRQRSDCGTTWKPATPPTRMCDHCLKESRGHLISPDYPDNYPPGLRCTYHIQRSKSFCGLEIFFHDFQLQDTPDCSGDALVIAGEDGERLCGSNLKGKMKKIDFPIGEPNEVVLQFESDDEGTAQGFHAEYRQIPCRGYPWRQGRSQWTPSNASDWSRSA